MASNSGLPQTAFGLGFRQHDSRKMNRILDHYERIPPNPNDRAALYQSLATLAGELHPKEAQSIESWLENGGDFPFTRPVRHSTLEPAYGFDAMPPLIPAPRSGQQHYIRHIGHDTRVDIIDLVNEEDNEEHNQDENENDQHVDDNPVPNPPIARRRPRTMTTARRRPGQHGLARPAAMGVPEEGHHVFDRLHRQGYNPVHDSFMIAGPGRRLGEEGEQVLEGPIYNGSEDGFHQAPHGVPRPLLHHPQRNETMDDDPNRIVWENYNPNDIMEDEDDWDDYEPDEDLEMEEDASINTGFVDSLPGIGWQLLTESRTEFSPPGKEPSLPEIECEVCFESLRYSNFPVPKITATCTHEAKVCYGCLATGIAIQVQDGILGQLNCPSCPEKLAFNNIRAYASRDVFARYEYLISQSVKDMHMCLAPNCGAGQVHNGGKEQPMMICNSCEFKTCIYHGRPWHEGQTCHEFDRDPAQVERLEEEEATAKLLAVDSRICPHCHQGVSKQIGCDHLSCRCGKNWCYVCEADWENVIRLGGAAHARHCIYHPDQIRKRPDQIEADRQRALTAVHGGAISEELIQARQEHQEQRRAAIRPLVAEAAEKRLQEVAKANNGKNSPHKKRKVNLKPAWEEGGHSRKAFGG